MKKINTTLALIFGLFLITQAQSAIQVSIKDCRLKNKAEKLSEFTLFKNDSLFKRVETKGQHVLTINDLALGKYRIEYTTKFGTTMNEWVDVVKSKTYKVDLCLFTMNYDKDPFTRLIDRLEDGETFSILMYSHDSVLSFPKDTFPSSDQVMTIKKSGHTYYAKYGGIAKFLYWREMEYLKNFETELNYVNIIGCATEVYYVLAYKDEVIKITDSSCSWDGFNILKRNLKFKEPK